MTVARFNLFPFLALSLFALLAAGCASHGGRAPVVERLPSSSPNNSQANNSQGNHRVTPAKSSVDPTGHNIYVVKRGDTLHQIALDEGLDWRDLARWNGLEDPSRIHVGQSLRLTGTQADSNESVSSAVSVAQASSGGMAQSSPINVGNAPGAPRPLDAPSSAAKPAEPATTTSVATSSAKPHAGSPESGKAVDISGTNDQLDWAWPVNRTSAIRLLTEFSEGKNKGVDIAGKPGDPVLAAADGKVVYSGNGLRGYGNLIIIKHNTLFLSTYAHNQALSVQEGDSVRRGQQIAQLGSSDADTPKLHFEIRRQGRPVDPLKLLPAK